MTGRFLSELEYRDISEGRDIVRLELTKPFGFHSEVLGCDFWVPEGFVSDGESIPSALHSVVHPFGLSRRAAVLHDALYKHAGYFVASLFFPVTRATADAVYREAVLVKGLASWRAWVRYYILRAFGWLAWNKHRTAPASSSPASPQCVARE